MKDLVIDGKKYQKATAVAKDLGYTSDYIGQLCRSGKIDAQLVGRSWYVHVDSIHTHKKGRYRQNQAKSKQAIKVYKEKQTASQTRQKETAVHHLRVTHYETDESDLIPQTKAEAASKPTESLAPEKPNNETVELTVDTKGQKNRYKPAEKKPVRFKGAVKVASAEVEASQPAIKPAPKQSPEKAQPVANAERFKNRLGVVVADKEESVSITVNHQSASKKKHTKFSLWSAAICSIILILAFTAVLGIDRVVVYELQKTEVMYTFNVENILKNMNISVKQE